MNSQLKVLQSGAVSLPSRSLPPAPAEQAHGTEASGEER